jgi:hypothetical protein
MNAFDPVETLTVMKSGGVETLTIVRQQDGGIKFTDANGNVQVVRDIGITKLFKALTNLDA